LAARLTTTGVKTAVVGTVMSEQEQNSTRRVAAVRGQMRM
jgi:hypothetical protein